MLNTWSINRSISVPVLTFDRTIEEPSNLKSNIFWGVKPFSLVQLYWDFEGAYCLHLQDRAVNQAGNQQEANSNQYELRALNLVQKQPRKESTENQWIVRREMRREINLPRAREQSMVFWAELSLPPVPTGFLLDLLFYHEDGGDLFLRNVWFFPKYKAIKPRRHTL
jgi:hypothetical protein